MHAACCVLKHTAQQNPSLIYNPPCALQEKPAQPIHLADDYCGPETPPCLPRPKYHDTRARPSPLWAPSKTAATLVGGHPRIHGSSRHAGTLVLLPPQENCRHERSAPGALPACPTAAGRVGLGGGQPAQCSGGREVSCRGRRLPGRSWTGRRARALQQCKGASWIFQRGPSGSARRTGPTWR